MSTYWSPRKWEKENEKVNGKKKRKPKSEWLPKNRKKFDAKVKKVMEKRNITKRMATKVVEGWWAGNRYNGPEPELPPKLKKQKEHIEKQRDESAKKKREKFIKRRGY